jgi:hypothetical protein
MMKDELTARRSPRRPGLPFIIHRSSFIIQENPCSVPSGRIRAWVNGMAGGGHRGAMNHLS